MTNREDLAAPQSALNGKINLFQWGDNKRVGRVGNQRLELERTRDVFGGGWQHLERSH